MIRWRILLAFIMITCVLLSNLMTRTIDEYTLARLFVQIPMLLLALSFAQDDGLNSK